MRETAPAKDDGVYCVVRGPLQLQATTVVPEKIVEATSNNAMLIWALANSGVKTERDVSASTQRHDLSSGTGCRNKD